MFRHSFCIWTLALALMIALPLAAPAQDTRESAEFKMAVNLFKDGLLDLAKEQLQNFISKYPNSQQSIEARYYLGLTYLKLGNFTEAKNTFQNMAITYPDHPKAPEAWWNVGEAFARMRNYSEAASAFERLKTFHPKHELAPKALLEASKYYNRAGNRENAAIALRAVLQEYPTSPEVLPARFAIGSLYIATGDYDRAFSELNRVAEGTTNQELKAKTMTAIGVLYGLIGNREEAEKRLRSVITTFSTTTAVHEAHVRLGDLLRQYQNFPEATAEYNATATNAQADSSIRQEAFIGAAECAIASGDFRGAVNVYNDFFAAFKGTEISTDVYFGAAKAAHAAGDHAAASQYYAVLLADTSLFRERRILLKRAAQNGRDGKNINAAVQYYQQYLNEYPADAAVANVMYEIAVLNETEWKNTSRSISLCTTILDRYSASTVADDALFSRARCRESRREFAEALDDYRQVGIQFPASEYAAAASKKVQTLSALAQTDSRSMAKRIAEAIETAGSANPAALDVLLGEIYLNDASDVSMAAKHFDDAVMKGISGAALERARYGRAVCEMMLAQRGTASTLEAIRLFGEFIRAYPGSPRRDDAAYNRFLLQSSEKAGSEVILAADEFLLIKPQSHVDEVTLLRANAKREAGRSSEAETEYTALLSSALRDIAADALYGRGVARMNLNNSSGAVADFQSYLTSNAAGPFAPEALLRLASIAERDGQYEKAATLYEEVSARFGYSSQYQSAVIKAVQALSTGKLHDRAVVRADLVLKKERDNPFASDEHVSEILFTLAEALAKKKEITRAKKMLQEYQATYPRGKRIADVFYALGQIYKDEGKIALATTYFQQSGKQSGNREASRDAAELLLESKKFDEAITEFKLLAEKTSQPKEKAYYESRIIVANFRAGNAAAAQANASEFKSKYPDALPNFEEFELERGKLMHQQRDYEHALDVFEEVADGKTPEIVQLGHLWIGKTYDAMNQGAKATEEFLKVIEKFPRTPAAIEANLSLGRMAFRAERWEDAAKYFKLVVDQPDVSLDFTKEALGGLIRAYDELNIAEGAAEMTKRFIILFPNDPTLFRKRVNLGVFYQKLTYFDQAITHYENLLGEATVDDQAEIRYYIGECYFGKAEYSQSIIEFLKVPYLVTKRTEIDWTAQSFFMAGQAYEKLSQYDKALAMYEQIKTRPGIDATFKVAIEKEINRVKALIK